MSKCFCHFNGYEVKDALSRKTKIGQVKNVAELKKSSYLEPGMVIKTLGYYNVNDGGSGLYEITSEVLEVNDYDTFQINSLYARLIVEDFVNVRQLGAYGDDKEDDTNVFKYAIEKYKNIKVPKGTYKITETLTIGYDYNIIGEHPYRTILKLYTENIPLIENNGYNNSLKKLGLTTNELKDSNTIGIFDREGYKCVYDNLNITKFNIGIQGCGCVTTLRNSSISNNNYGYMFYVPEGTEDARTLIYTCYTFLKNVFSYNGLGIGSQTDGTHYPTLEIINIDECTFEYNNIGFQLKEYYQLSINSCYFENNTESSKLNNRSVFTSNNWVHPSDPGITYENTSGYEYGSGGRNEVGSDYVSTKLLKLQNYENSSMTNEGKITLKELKTNANSNNRTPSNQRSVAVVNSDYTNIEYIPKISSNSNKVHNLIMNIMLDNDGTIKKSSLPEGIEVTVTKLETGKFEFKFNCIFDNPIVFHSCSNSSSSSDDFYTTITYKNTDDQASLTNYRAVNQFTVCSRKGADNSLVDTRVTLQIQCAVYWLK